MTSWLSCRSRCVQCQQGSSTDLANQREAIASQTSQFCNSISMQSCSDQVRSIKKLVSSTIITISSPHHSHIIIISDNHTTLQTIFHIPTAAFPHNNLKSSSTTIKMRSAMVIITAALATAVLGAPRQCSVKNGSDGKPYNLSCERPTDHSLEGLCCDSFGCDAGAGGAVFGGGLDPLSQTKCQCSCAPA